MNELRVLDVVRQAARSNANDPKASEIALLVTAVSKSVLAAFHHLLVSALKIVLLAAPEAFCCTKYLLVPLLGHHAALYACHISFTSKGC